MKLTQHIKERMNQRNIPDSAIDIILKNGRISHVSGGAMRIFLGNKESNQMIMELRNTIKLIERAKGGTLILAEDTALTVYRVH